MRAWLALWALVVAGCLSDLVPEVGALNRPNLDAGESPSSGGNGSDPDNSGNGATGSNGMADGGGSGNGDDGGSNASNAGEDAGQNAGNSGSNGENNGSGGSTGCNIKDSNPAKVVSFKQDIWPVLSGCRCHDSEDPEQPGILEVGFVIDDYVSLRKGGDNTRAKVIVDGNACESLILKKLSEEPPFGVRMPKDGPYLSNETRTLISDWIVEGARDN